jgi:hypothetical protein
MKMNQRVDVQIHHFQPQHQNGKETAAVTVCAGGWVGPRAGFTLMHSNMHVHINFH